MKPSSYGERDYAFGQAMLTLRTAIGLTQAGLAEFLGVSRKAVGGWELTQVGFFLAQPEKGEEEKRTGEYAHQVA